jgi:uncharacterized protein (DUF1499 family)
MFKKLIKVIILLAIIGVPARMYMKGKESQTMRPDLGVSNNQLTPCPEKPNCVSSFASVDDSTHYIDPRKVTADPFSKIKTGAITAQLKLVDFSSNYLRFSFTSKTFGFVDDIEFYYQPNEQLLHFRSSSRVGHSDLGKNRSRLTEFLDSLKL